MFIMDNCIYCRLQGVKLIFIKVRNNVYILLIRSAYF